MSSYIVWYDEDYRKDEPRIQRWWIKKIGKEGEDKHYAGPFAREVEGEFVADGYRKNETP